MDGSAFRGIGEALVICFWVAVFSVPFAIWKLIDLIIWLCRHLNISWQ